MRTVLITGASGGLGGAVVAALESGGDRVVAASHPEYDLTRADEAGRAVAAAGPELSALIHLVGGYAGGMAVSETSDDVWRRMQTLNLDTAFYAARAAVPVLAARPGGRVVLIGARPAVEPVAGLAAYAVAKAGVVALARTLALELAPRQATCNVVLPSVIDTPANRAAMPKADFSRWVSPASLALVIAWLASPAASDVNGAVVPVYGRV
jgi:NAD(P)-dependent dehydrogenase (short-subunit alcohol dehydrogenase family)